MVKTREIGLLTIGVVVGMWFMSSISYMAQDSATQNCDVSPAVQQPSDISPAIQHPDTGGRVLSGEGVRVLSEVVDETNQRWLAIRQPIIPLNDEGYVKVDYNKIKRFAFDIGTSVNSPSVKGNPMDGWIMPDLDRGGDLHVFMIEPNKYSAGAITLESDPAFINDKSDKFKTWGGCSNVQCTADWYKSVRSSYGQWHLINAAAGDKELYLSAFQSGYYENVGTGSIFPIEEGFNGYKNKVVYTQPTPTAMISVAAVAKYIPLNMPIEVIKIDAQGFDAKIVVSIPIDVLQRTKCLIGEFDLTGYDVSTRKDSAPDHRLHLQKANFVYVKQVWFNKAFKEDFAAGVQNFCFTWDVPPVPAKDILASMI